MFEVMDHNGIEGAFEVRGHGDRVGEVAIFLGPRARERAAAYAQRENAEAAYQRRWTDPGFTAAAGPERSSGARQAEPPLLKW
jgi:hypothetical protein